MNFLNYTRPQQSALLVLVVLIFGLQQMQSVRWSPPPKNAALEAEWLAWQPVADSLKTVAEASAYKLRPFNPNFISDYKGYTLGMSVAEIDRLHAFREQNRFVNSAEEFQRVTHISDSLLAVLTPYFKFPDWVRKSGPKKAVTPPVKIDINRATQDELMSVYGIGPALSVRILKHRDALGGYANIEQVADVWGLSDEVVSNVKQRFLVRERNLKKWNVNEASLQELSQFPYFGYRTARAVVAHRTMNGPIAGPDDLSKINGFPSDKLKIIALYLDF